MKPYTRVYGCFYGEASALPGQYIKKYLLKVRWLPPPEV